MFSIRVCIKKKKKKNTFTQNRHSLFFVAATLVPYVPKLLRVVLPLALLG